MKNNKNNLIAMLLIAAMVLPLAGCGKKTDGEESGTTNETSVTIPETHTSETDNEDKYGEETTVASTEETTVPTISSEETSTANTEETAPSSSETTASTTVKKEAIDDKLRNSINMLNYMSSLTRRINEEKGNQLYLETAYDSFDNLFPNSVDQKTQTQVTSLMDTIQSYRMISVKRERLQYIYEKNSAQAYRKAIPNPIGLLSAIQSKNKYQIAAAAAYMVMDSATGYVSAKSQADAEFIKDGWKLDDEEATTLHNSTKQQLNYMIDMVRNYGIPGDYALSKEAIENFVSWSSKPDSQLGRKISWFEANQKTYSEFGPYWLELAKDYYKNQDFKKCLDSVRRYESISTRIFRKDKDYASVLPLAIVSAKETMSNADYVKVAKNYCAVIIENSRDKDWSIRYFVAQIYMDLYSITKDKSYIDKAYEIANINVNNLVDEQKKLNSTYLSDIVLVKAGKDATKQAKKEIKQYNKTIKAERKIALPPISEALYLNADLLFGLAKEKNVSASEKTRIENMLHENGESIFLVKPLDDRYWFSKPYEATKATSVSVDFDGSKITIPASCLTDRSKIVVTVSGVNGSKSFENWEVIEVKRPKNSKDCSEFKVTLKLKDTEKYKYQPGETVEIKIIPIEEIPELHWDYKYNVVETKTAFVIKGVKFERVS